SCDPHALDEQFFSVDSFPRHWTSSNHICPVPSPKYAKLFASTTLPQPSSLHTTAASVESH
ncbi:hypothetical protein M9458_008856, partial [Cirrhinus mrigala]